MRALNNRANLANFPLICNKVRGRVVKLPLIMETQAASRLRIPLTAALVKLPLIMDPTKGASRLPIPLTAALAKLPLIMDNPTKVASLLLTCSHPLMMAVKKWRVLLPVTVREWPGVLLPMKAKPIVAKLRKGANPPMGKASLPTMDKEAPTALTHR